jgi:hypothetical protein
MPSLRTDSARSSWCSTWRTLRKYRCLVFSQRALSLAAAQYQHRVTKTGRRNILCNRRRNSGTGARGWGRSQRVLEKA